MPTFRSPLFTSAINVAWMAAAGLALSACASRVEVRSLGSADPSQAFYEMRGHRLAALQQRAAQLCPGGYTVLRQWQLAYPGDSHAGLPAKALVKVADVVAPGEQDSAQLLVQCAAPGGSGTGTGTAINVR